MVLTINKYKLESYPSDMIFIITNKGDSVTGRRVIQSHQDDGCILALKKVSDHRTSYKFGAWKVQASRWPKTAIKMNIAQAHVSKTFTNSNNSISGGFDGSNDANFYTSTMTQKNYDVGIQRPLYGSGGLGSSHHITSSSSNIMKCNSDRNSSRMPYYWNSNNSPRDNDSKKDSSPFCSLPKSMPSLPSLRNRMQQDYNYGFNFSMTSPSKRENNRLHVSPPPLSPSLPTPRCNNKNNKNSFDYLLTIALSPQKIQCSTGSLTSDKSNYSTSSNEVSSTRHFMYGSHNSSLEGVALHYLRRISSFDHLRQQLQEGHFDVPPIIETLSPLPKTNDDFNTTYVDVPATFPGWLNNTGDYDQLKQTSSLTLPIPTNVSSTLDSNKTLGIGFVLRTVWTLGLNLRAIEDEADNKKMFSHWRRREFQVVKFPSRDTVCCDWLNPEISISNSRTKTQYFYSVDYRSEKIQMAKIIYILTAKIIVYNTAGHCNVAQHGGKMRNEFKFRYIWDKKSFNLKIHEKLSE